MHNRLAEVCVKLRIRHSNHAHQYYQCTAALVFRFAPNIAVNALSKLHSEGNGFINLSSYFLCAMQDKQYKESH